MRLPLHNVIPLTKIIFRTVAKYPVPLLKAFAWPALMIVLLSLVRMSLATFLPAPAIPLIPGIATGFLASLTLVNVVRYLDLDEEPPLDPRRIAWRAVTIVSLILIPLCVMLYACLVFVAVSQSAGVPAETTSDAWRGLLIMFAQFVIASLAMGVTYPLAGPIALLQRFELKSSWRMIRDSLAALIMLASLLLVFVTFIEIAYLIVAANVFVLIKDSLSSMPHAEMVIASVFTIFGLPVVFFAMVLPAIAVAHLTQGLGRRILESVMVLASAPEDQK